MIAKMTKEGSLQVYAETEAEIYMLKCWERNYREGKGASFETFARFEQKTTQFSAQQEKLTNHEINM